MEQKSTSIRAPGAPGIIVTESAPPTVPQIEAAIMGVIENIDKKYHKGNYISQELKRLQAEVAATRRIIQAIGTVITGMNTSLDEVDRLWIAINGEIIEGRKDRIRKRREVL